MNDIVINGQRYVPAPQNPKADAPAPAPETAPQVPAAAGDSDSGGNPLLGFAVGGGLGYLALSRTSLSPHMKLGGAVLAAFAGAMLAS